MIGYAKNYQRTVRATKNLNDTLNISAVSRSSRFLGKPKAPIVIFDEATANVDPENEEELTRRKTVDMITHSLKTIRNAGQILVVDAKKIV